MLQEYDMNPSTTESSLLNFFKRFEENHMVEVFSEDSHINKGYNNYITAYRKIRDQFIQNASKPVLSTNITPLEYLKNDVNAFLKQHEELENVNYVEFNAFQTSSPEKNKNLAIQYFSIRNQTYLSENLLKSIEEEIYPQKNNITFKRFFKKASNIFSKKDGITLDKKFLSEKTPQERKLYYKDCSELLEIANLPFITFSELPSTEAREDQARRIINASREAFINMGLPVETISTCGGTGLLFEAPKKASKIAGSSIQLKREDGSKMNILSLPNKKPTPGSQLEIDYHMTLKETITHETFHSLDVLAFDRMKNSEFVEEQIHSYATEVALSTLYSPIFKDLDNMAISRKNQEIIASVYGDMSVEKYQEFCMEQSDKLVKRTALVLLQEAVGYSNFQNMSQDEIQTIVNESFFQEATMTVISYSKNIDDILCSKDGIDLISNNIFVNLLSNSESIKNLTEEQQIELFEQFKEKLPESFHKIKELAKNSGLVLNMNNSHVTRFQETADLSNIKTKEELRFTSSNSALSWSNDESYETNNHYWTSTIEVMARVAQASIKTPSKKDNNSRVIENDLLSTKHDFILNKETQKQGIELFHLLATKIGITPLQQPEESPIIKGDIQPYFRSKSDGFLNRNAMNETQANPYDKPGLHLNDSFIKSAGVKKDFPEAIAKLDLKKFNV